MTAVPCDFTLVDIQAPFGHVSHPSLGLLGGKGVEVVNKRRLVGDLKVPDAAVTLETRSHVREVSLGIKLPDNCGNKNGFPDSLFRKGRQRWCRDHRRAAELRCWSPSLEHILAHPCCPGDTEGRVGRDNNAGLGSCALMAPISPAADNTEQTTFCQIIRMSHGKC